MCGEGGQRGGKCPGLSFCHRPRPPHQMGDRININILITHPQECQTQTKKTKKKTHKEGKKQPIAFESETITTSIEVNVPRKKKKNSRRELSWREHRCARGPADNDSSSEQVDRSGITWRASTAGRSTLRRRDIREGIVCPRVERTRTRPTCPFSGSTSSKETTGRAGGKTEGASGTIGSIECEQ